MGRMSKEKEALGLTKDQLNPGAPEDAAKYSEIVYRNGGAYRFPKGGTFSCRGVTSEQELAEALESGWFRTPEEAIKGGTSEADEIRAELKKMREEKLLDAERAELEELRKWKAEREAAANGEATKPVETATTSEFTPEELYALYIDNGKDYKKVTELTGVRSAHLKIQPYAKQNGLEV